MLTGMQDAAQLVWNARTAAGLSVRSMAERAGVPASTISRVESRRVDPTVGMLRRILDGAGQDLVVTGHTRTEGLGPTIAELADAWRTTPLGPRPDWTRLRAFVDYLMLKPVHIRTAIAHAPWPSGVPIVDALLASMAEKLADDRGLPRPKWTGTVPGLDQEWLTPGTPRMQAAVRSATPPQFLRRGLLVDSGSLWRQGATGGA
jgi:DNA-binding XRE family transcriptional regulator